MADEEVIYVDENNNPTSPPNKTQTNTGQSYSYPPTQSTRSDKADILDKIRPDLIVEIMRHKLMGEDLVKGVWKQQPQLQSRALTPIGAWDISNLMLPVSSQNVSISKLDDDSIRKRSLSIAKTAQKMCLKNWKEYGITGTDQLEFVHQIVFSNTIITLKQPEGGGIRDLIKGTSSESRNIMYNDSQPQKRGFFRR